MKDHYKILGLKENASADEIRERWIELIKQYHPDLGKGKGVEGKIEDINEAYQILKFSSTRMPYDLRRAHDRKKRRLSARRIILTIAIPVLIAVVFVLSILFFKKPQIPLESKVMPSSVLDPEPVHHPPLEEAVVSSTKKSMTSGSETRVKDKTAKEDSGRTAKIEEKEIVTEEPELITVPPRAESEIPEDRLPPPVQMDQVRQANLTSQVNQTSPSPPAPKAAPALNADPAPKAPVSSEEEVKRFYANYIERYTQKDIDGFLSCFSAKAIQNQRAGFDEIRKIYANFFNLSDELRYHMEGMKIAFNQNHTEVRAFYELDQILRKGRESKTWRGHIRWTLVREEGYLKILSLDYQQQKSP